MDLIKLTDSPLDIAEALASVNLPEAGGIDIFIGTTRIERHPEHGQLVALDYSAYPEMALSEMHKLATAARRQWPICRIAILHRTGRCPLAESSVIIAVSTPHRADAFAACRFLIDQLKTTVPIWKKEVYAEGEAWVTGQS
jgi:molybdopterin synthase catalytic subunit